MSVATEPVMRARGINKVFGATHALRGVDFDVVPGQVTALFGENGAGKSTLMKILAGIEAPTTGTLELDGQPVEIKGPRDAADRGIAIIHQELSLFPNLSIADNVFMARERIRSRRDGRPAAPARDHGEADGAPRRAARLRDSGRRPARRPAADRRDRPRAGAGGAGADHGRADVGAQRSRGRRAVPRDPRADRGRRGDRLHLPPSRRGARDRRPCRRLPRRSARRRGRGRRGRHRPGSSRRWSGATRTSSSPTEHAQARRGPCSRSRGSSSPTRPTRAG